MQTSNQKVTSMVSHETMVQSAHRSPWFNLSLLRAPPQFGPRIAGALHQPFGADQRGHFLV